MATEQHKEIVAALISTLDTGSASSGSALGTKSVDGILLLASASRSGVPSGAARFVLPNAIDSIGTESQIFKNPFSKSDDKSCQFAPLAVAS